MPANTRSPTESLQEQLLQLLASGDTQAILGLIAGLETRANAESDRANKQTVRADAAVDEADALGERVRKLEYQTNWLRRLIYSRRSEKLNAADLRQLSLALGGDGGSDVPTPQEPDSVDESTPPGESPEPGPKPKTRRPNHHGRTPLPPDLERVVSSETLVPDNERSCMHCGDIMCEFGWIEHETVERIPAKFVVNVERREKVACKNRGCPGEAVTAEREHESVLPMRVGASVLADLVERKCDDAMPIYRLRDEYARLGFDVPLNTLYRYWTFPLDMLLPVADATLGVVLDEGIVCIDDTGMPVLDRTKPSGKFRGHLWAFKGSVSGLVAFQFTETWKAAEIQPWLEAIGGFIQVDDYKGYSATVESMAKAGRMVTLVPPGRRLGCSMHVRRRFYDSFKSGDKRAAPAIDMIRKIYEVEAEAKSRGLDAQGRLALREEKSVPILEGFFAWAEEMKPKLGKTSKLAEAVRYALNQQPYIERCFTDGRFEIDNGEIERTLKKPCVGRKNYLHCGSVQGAKRLAAAYTLVLSCKNLGIRPYDYLVDVISKLANGWPLSKIRELVPDAWAAARTSAANPSGE